MIACAARPAAVQCLACGREADMDQDALMRFLGWSLAINYALLMAWFLAFVFARDAVLRLHARWFRLDHARFDAIHYAGMAAYKLATAFFNLVPLLALWLADAGVAG